MDNYYAKGLNSQNLYKVYDTEIPRIQQYLQEEINVIQSKLKNTHRVLELGAGYGRIVKALAPYCESILGIDISEENIRFGKEYIKEYQNAQLSVMDVHTLEFHECFDIILCLQNGLSSMKMEYPDVEKIYDLLSPGGAAYFSSYSPKFWENRLQWFEEQSHKGLLGEIDYENTKNGIIVCKDGFQAKTHSAEDFHRIGENLGCPYQVFEIDESSVFLTLFK